VAGDARARLDWNENTETDVTGYRVYRATTAGGPYAFIVAVPVPGHDDLGLTNGVTYYYVVTATDARAHSGYSNGRRPSRPRRRSWRSPCDRGRRAECLFATTAATTTPWYPPTAGVAARAGRRARSDARAGRQTSCHPDDDCGLRDPRAAPGTIATIDVASCDSSAR
jgi:hypothetical protein